MNIDEVKNKIENALAYGDSVILTSVLGVFHRYLLFYPTEPSIYTPKMLESIAITRASSSNITTDHLLALSMIAKNNKDYDIKNDDILESKIKSVLIHIFETRFDEAISLIHSDRTRSNTVYTAEENYNYLFALENIYHSIASLQMIARDMASTISKSISTHLKRYSNDGAPAIYYSIRRNNLSGEYRRFTDDKTAVQSIYGLGFAYFNDLSAGHRPYFMPSLLESAKVSFDSENYTAVSLFGQPLGYERENFDVDDNTGRFEKRYPYSINLRENIRIGGMIYGAAFINELMPLITQPSALATINEYREIETDGLIDQIALAYLWYWGESGVEHDRMTLPHSIAKNLNSIPQKIPQRSLEAFSWNNMPTHWIKLNDKTTRLFHDAYIGGIHYAYNRLGNLDREFNPVITNDKVLDWLCFINGVPDDSIDILPRVTKERLIGMNRAIMRSRNTYPSMKALVNTYNKNVYRFEHYKPYQPINDTLHRHSNGGIWTLEVEPNTYGSHEIKKLWKTLQSGYTSARYLLVLTALNARITLDPVDWNADQIYNPGDIVGYNGLYYRVHTTGGTSAPDQGQKTADGLHYYGLISEISPDDSHFYSGMMTLNATGLREIDGILYGDTGELNSSLTHLSTAWRYPPSMIDDYSFRMTERQLDRKDIALGYMAGSMIYNSPQMSLVLGNITRSSGDTVMNEDMPAWVNLLEALG